MRRRCGKFSVKNWRPINPQDSCHACSPTSGSSRPALPPRSLRQGRRLNLSVCHLESVLHSCNTSADVYADKDYAGRRIEQQLREQGYRPRIQRKAAPKKPLGARQGRRNRRIARTRARVEHIFAALPQCYDIGVRCIGRARALLQLTFAAAAYNMRRLAFLRETGVTPF
ncbi:hypothetical protein CKO15_12640 [Halorhodospira abdelmalekii]|uniref:transposase n=1 Tax=Halorhodospira abdelmalekii TaxID=421629 RepID=UPI00237A42E3|nr:transposase [Halorhodospira abdelmalekii]MBK1736101.1 hypothetical protein [Halorhodospira abdelmalekii]